jgi:S1-C subfamily serine protease
MKRTLLLTALTLCLGSAAAAEPAPAAASGDTEKAATRDARTESARAELAELRAQMKELSGKMAKLSTELGDVGPRAYAYRYLGDPDRAVIGVVLSPEPKGARISAITPDGPAARAGLRDGDVIVAIDGKRIADAAAPQEGLREARDRLGELKDGQQVRLTYERAGKVQPELTLKAARREAYNWPRVVVGDAEVVRMQDLDKTIREQVERAREAAASIDYDSLRDHVAKATADAQSAMRRVMPWWGLNLVAINPDLGRYFGSDHGALVVSVDSATRSDLRGGDVILEVAGERVDDPGDALRALRDQPSGKDVPFKVLRERKTITLNIQAPEYKSIFSAMPLPPPAPSAPLPPSPPSPPPAPPAPPAES